MIQVTVGPVAASDHLLIPAPSEIVWSAIAVAIIAVLLVKFALPKFNAILDERSEKIEAGLNMAETAKQEIAAAKESSKRAKAEAQQEAAKIREAAQEDAKKIVAAARVKAQEEANRILAGAQRQIQAERQAAEITLRSDIGLLASELAEKIVGEQLKDTELSARVIDRFLADLEAETTVKGAID